MGLERIFELLGFKKEKFVPGRITDECLNFPEELYLSKIFFAWCNTCTLKSKPANKAILNLGQDVNYHFAHYLAKKHLIENPTHNITVGGVYNSFDQQEAKDRLKKLQE